MHLIKSFSIEFNGLELIFPPISINMRTTVRQYSSPSLIVLLKTTEVIIHFIVSFK